MNCGLYCPSCGGIMFTGAGSVTCGNPGLEVVRPKYGTVTDDNGTWPIVLKNWVLWACGTEYGETLITGTRTVVDDSWCGTVDAPFRYAYKFQCNTNGTVTLQLYAALTACGGQHYAINNGFVLSAVQSITITPTCTGGNLTGDFTFSNLSGSGEVPPGGVAHVSIPYGMPDTQCCVPCDIPLTDLVMRSSINPLSPLTLHYVPGYLTLQPTMFWYTDCFAYTNITGPANARYVFGCGPGPAATLGIQIFYNHDTFAAEPCIPGFVLDVHHNAAAVVELMVAHSTCDPFSIAFGSVVDDLVQWRVELP